jgi:hypothetical protein
VSFLFWLNAIEADIADPASLDRKAIYSPCRAFPGELDLPPAPVELIASQGP